MPIENQKDSLLDDCLAFIEQIRNEQEKHGDHGDADYIHKANRILARAATVHPVKGE